jgi:Ca2+-binding RTX toxin-like protein
VALAGDDVVEGDSGNDIASLGDGSDRFIWNPGDGDDIVDGGDGTDSLEFNGSAAPEFMTVMTLPNGGFRFFRNVGDITVDATTVEVIEANSGDGNDVIIASGQTDPTVSLVVEAGGGNDVIVGGAGNDDLRGNTGDDVAFGFSGACTFTGSRTESPACTQSGVTRCAPSASYAVITPQTPSVSTGSSSASGRSPRCHSRSTRTCFAMPAGSSWRTMATTRGPCSTTSGTRTSSTRSGTPKWRPTDSRTFGGADDDGARENSDDTVGEYAR